MVVLFCYSVGVVMGVRVIRTIVNIITAYPVPMIGCSTTMVGITIQNPLTTTTSMTLALNSVLH
jgi:hypothetical protein